MAFKIENFFCKGFALEFIETGFNNFDIVFCFGFRKVKIRNAVLIHIVDGVAVEIKNFRKHYERIGFEDPVGVFAFKNSFEIRNHFRKNGENRAASEAGRLHSLVSVFFKFGYNNFIGIEILLFAVEFSGKMFFNNFCNIVVIHFLRPLFLYFLYNE